MERVLKNLKPENVFRIFEDICKFEENKVPYSIELGGSNFKKKSWSQPNSQNFHFY